MHVGWLQQPVAETDLIMRQTTGLSHKRGRTPSGDLAAFESAQPRVLKQLLLRCPFRVGRFAAKGVGDCTSTWLYTIYLHRLKP